MQRIMMTAMAVWLATSGARAGEEAADPVQREVKQDVVLRALVDELERSNADLKLEDLERPYFIEYTLIDAVEAYVGATLGTVLRRNQNHSRFLRTQVRVGSHELDNANFRGPGYYYSGQAPVPIEDDYHAIRQAIWWATDRNYKGVVETFARKKAFMETKVIEDKPNDLSREEPVVHFDEKADMSVDLDRLEKTVVQVSQVFRNYSAVRQSRVSVEVRGGNRYLVNTEGTRLRTRDRLYSLSVTATVQADDGMKFFDAINIHTRSVADLPSVDELAKRCGRMVKRLVAVRSAPKLETYTGPVLFEAEAAARLFKSHFGPRFAGGQRAVGSRSRPDDFAKKLGQRILPRFMDVVDDPTRETISDVSVIGHYTYDNQAVKARRVPLVESGRLKALLMSRNPSREFDHSTGHGRGQYGASPGCLIVTVRDGADSEALKKELIEACQDEGLEFGIRVAALSGGGASGPLVIYKVYPDGREELVRGAEIANIDIKAFKRLLAAGDTPYVLNTGGRVPQTLAAPAMLFEELDLAKIDRDFDKPPILPSPLAR